MDSSQSPARSESSPTASPRSRASKYASEEEKKAAQRERKRLWAQKKRAELKRLAAEAAANKDANASPDPKPAPADPIPPPATVWTPANAPRIKKEEPQPVKPVVKKEIKQEPNEVVNERFVEYDSASIFPPGYPKTDTIIIPPPSTPHSQLLGRQITPIDVMVMFLPGNPGVIGYYDKYLHELATQLAWSDSNVRYDILGISHAGFHLNSEGDPSHQLYSLSDQIALKVELLNELWKARPKLKVVLVGHSVGAYILMETIRGIKNQIEPENRGEIIGGVCLFPTVTHISKSPRGRRFTPILTTSWWMTVCHWYIRCLTFLLPAFLLDLFLRIILPRFSSADRKVTASFLRSPVGIKECMHMSKHEMLEINEDTWDDTMWGVEENYEKAPDQELIFYWGDKDSWVDQDIRDELIKKRARGGKDWSEDPLVHEDEDDEDDTRPKMIICKEGVQHSFSIAHSETMASKTSAWIEEIVENHFSKHAK